MFPRSYSGLKVGLESVWGKGRVIGEVKELLYCYGDDVYFFEEPRAGSFFFVIISRDFGGLTIDS